MMFLRFRFLSALPCCCWISSPPTVDTSIAFPFMKEIDNFAPDQPLIEEGRFLWPGPEGNKKKSVDGTFATGLYVVDQSIDPPILGSSYCTYGPDMDCFTTGWPTCCGDDSIECPDEQPECEIPTIVPTIDGSSYCTYSPDYSCYESGWPECCESDSIECTNEEDEQPECDITSIVGESYCVYAPNPECYVNWWPACCSDDSIECPKEKPKCEIAPIVPIIPGSSYCTYGPDYSCYDSGWPECCGDDSIECPEEQPSCEITCKTLGK
jgi:hypothetical protein